MLLSCFLPLVAMLDWLSYFYYLSETNKWEQMPPLPLYKFSQARPDCQPGSVILESCFHPW